MRMRKKKHRSERLERCDALMVEDISRFYGDIKGIFESEKPLYIEIGCGKGGFINSMAEQNPDINFLAIEKNQDVLVLAMEKALNSGVKNLKFVSGDAQMLGDMNTKSKADRIYINFCDPWQKTRHKKRRLTHERFLKIYQEILKEHGEIHFKTDNQKLFEFSLNSFSDYGMRLKNITLDLHASDFKGNVLTEYEKLFSEKGQPIYRCEAVFR